MPSPRRRPFAVRSLWVGLGLGVPLTLAGCVNQTTQGSATTFTYELWLTLLVFLGGVAAVPAGWALRKRVVRLGWALLIVGPILSILVAPSIYCDRVVVDDETFRVRTGFWGSNDEAIRFANLQSVQLTEEVKRTRRGKQTTTYLLCNLKGGGQTKLAISGNLASWARATILTGIARHGVPLIE